MNDCAYMEMEAEYENWAEQLYQDHLEYSFYDFLKKRKEDCAPLKAYSLPKNLHGIHSFWEVS